ncbi:UTP--glucose-1-phosphate uridylyltransferase [candidate division Kazan bacterium]|uniref:UTP--glucose-1-phosphate uridylyltransferase n=1 Tax=candidate division Kazan bacterium TaxID=2202143 RepID=A0A420ZCH2_UNCK3|nr:MAG: UTP--glucose-1-phosphate uridylyltransferase [candidate division Kazan bacterium]
MVKKVRKAVIAVAGFGTRFLPITKTIPKEMLPILNKPIIQHIVEELSASGIEEIILVTNWQKKAVEDHFDPSIELEHQLIKQGRSALVAQMKKISSLAKFIYIRQIEGYGNALPIITAENIVGDEPFIYAFGDDLVKSRVPFAKQLIETYKKYGCSIVGVQKVSSKEVSKYGIVRLRQKTRFLEDIIEKPSQSEAPSNLAVFGRYLFTPDIFKAMRAVKKGRSDEYWTADGIRILAKTQPIATQKVRGGRWLTTGDPISYLNALIEYALDDPKLKKQITFNK